LDKNDSFITFPTLNSTRSDISPYTYDRTYSTLSNEAIISRLITNPNKSSLYSSYQSSILSPNSQRYSTFSDDNRNSPTSAGPYLRTSRSQTNMKSSAFDYSGDEYERKESLNYEIKSERKESLGSVNSVRKDSLGSVNSTRKESLNNVRKDSLNSLHSARKENDYIPPLPGPSSQYSNQNYNGYSSPKLPGPPPNYLPPQPPQHPQHQPLHMRSKSNSSLNSAYQQPPFFNQPMPPMPQSPALRFHNINFERRPSAPNIMSTPQRKESKAIIFDRRPSVPNIATNINMMNNVPLPPPPPHPLNENYTVPVNDDIKSLEWLMDDLMINMKDYTNPHDSDFPPPNFNNNTNHLIKLDPQTFYCKKCAKSFSAQAITPDRKCMKCYQPVQAICAFCLKPIEGKELSKNVNIFCVEDYINLFVPKCKKCNQPIKGETVTALGGKYHRDCFTCIKCDKKFTNKSFYVFDGQPVCRYHFHMMNNTICKFCNEPVEGQCIDVVEGRFHPDCFRCCECHELLSTVYYNVQGKIYCENDTFRQHKDTLMRKRTTMKSYVEPKFYNQRG